MVATKAKLIIAGVAAVAFISALAVSHWWVFSKGKQLERADWIEREAKRKALGEEVREAVREQGALIAKDVNESIKGIRITNTTSDRQIEKEKETHYVLSDPNCGVPVSTVRLRNESRIDPDPARRARQRLDAGMREPALAPGERAVTPGR